MWLLCTYHFSHKCICVVVRRRFILTIFRIPTSKFCLGSPCLYRWCLDLHNKLDEGCLLLRYLVRELAGKYINICAVVHFIIPRTTRWGSLISWWLRYRRCVWSVLVQFLMGMDFYVPQCIQTDSGTHLASCFIGNTASFQRVKWWSLKLTVHLRLVVQRLMCGAIHTFLSIQ